jgi:hypothetical protein
MNLEFNKYKRVFAFGCSFTSYLWPTWADVIASECPDALFFNFGRSGAGNLNISCRIAEAHNVFKFSSTDLVMVMWSSYSREDRWVNGSWLTCGNIFGNDTYDATFRKKFADPLGYLIRDMGVIYNTHKMLETLPCDTLKLFSYSVKTKLDEGEHIYNFSKYNQLITAYKDFIDENIKDTMFDTLFVDKKEINDLGHNFIRFNRKTIEYDPHPNTLTYYNYLKMLDINLTEKSKVFAEESYAKLKKCVTQDEIQKAFPEVGLRADDGYILLV